MWQNKALVLYDLRSDSPVLINHSQFFPQLDLEILAQHIDPNNQPQSVRNFLKAIRPSD